MSSLVLWDQRYFASIRRRDGHTIDGTPGDCLRASVATVLRLPYDDVPHFAMFRRTWWETMRLHAQRFGLDWACVVDLSTTKIPPGESVIACGPSPRGPFWHAVVADRTGRVIHDPHPSRAGLASVEEFLVLVAPYAHLRRPLELLP